MGSEPDPVAETRADQAPRGDTAPELCWSFGEMSGSEPPAPFEAASLVPGAVFGERFLIGETLGRGGMGYVFEAFDRTTERPVALKVMRTVLGGTALERFLREGELTAKLDHPGILKIHGGGVTVEGFPFLVLELLEGARTLGEVLPEVSLDRALDLLQDAARALGFAHRKGVVHRDVKPGNIMVDAQGRVRLLDFGVAWSGDSGRLTKTGEMVGTPLFMAPECFSASAKDVRPASDVWSLGVILYEHLTGQGPFESRSMMELMGRVSTAEVVPPRKLNPKIPRPIEALCLRALARDPKDRYPDGDAFADAVDRARFGEPTPPGRRGLPLAATLATLAFAGTLAGLLSMRPDQLPSPVPPAPTPTSGVAPAPEAPAQPIAPAEPAAAPELEALERKLAALKRETERPIPLQPSLLQELLDLEGEAAPHHPSLIARIQLVRLEYLTRRGRWEQALEGVARLEVDPGPTGDRAALLHAVLVYCMRLFDDPEKQRAMAACRSRWERPRERRGAPELACGAWLALFGQDPDSALERSRRAQELDPTLLAAILAEAVAHGRLLRINDSIPAVERARSLAPDHPLPLFLLALSCLNLRDGERAISATSEALSLLEPEPPWIAWKYHLTVLTGLKRFQAIEDLAASHLSREPTHPHWRFVHGWVLCRSRDKQWRGLLALRELQQEAPDLFATILAHFEQRAEPRTELLRRMRETPLAHLQAGVIYEQAIGLYQAADYVRSSELLREAAEAGLPEAMFLYGENHTFGRGVPKDDATAALWYQKAAEAGFPFAMYSLGVCYAKGQGVAQDHRESLHWYREAAERGNVKAMNNLGNALRNGWGGLKDDEQAEYWWLRAANEHQSGAAMANLGRLYAETELPFKARRWWEQALLHTEDPLKAQVRKNLRLLHERFPELNR